MDSKTKKQNHWYMTFDARHFLDGAITPHEAILLAYIANFRRNGKLCFVSNERLAEVMHSSESAIGRMLQNLEKLGLIHREIRRRKGGSARLIEVNDPVADDYEKQRLSFIETAGQHSPQSGTTLPRSGNPHYPEMGGALYIKEKKYNIHTQPDGFEVEASDEQSGLTEQEKDETERNKTKKNSALDSNACTETQKSETSNRGLNQNLATEQELRFDSPLSNSSEAIKKHYNSAAAPAANPDALRRILKVFKVRNTDRKLTPGESRAWNKIKKDITEEDLSAIEQFYANGKSAKFDITWNQKHAPQQLMNDWYAQADHAYKWLESNKPKTTGFDPIKSLVFSRNWRKSATAYAEQMPEGEQRDSIIELANKKDQDLTPLDLQTIKEYITEGEW